PDIVIREGSRPIPEYNNTALIMGMFPKLYPFGIGGFESDSRGIPLSFQKQAAYYLDIQDRSFRIHNSFIFVVNNIIQRRQAHLHTALSVSKARFKDVAKELTSITPAMLHKVAKHLEDEGKIQELTEEEKSVFQLLREVNAIAAHVPGSEASKLFARSEISSYMGYIGMPQIYLTLNPNPHHSPIFQVMVGDEKVDLSQQFPELAPSPERARRLAEDPVAAADFFDFSIRCIFQHLFGWDFQNGRSYAQGGILGRLKAFYGTTE
ncbi:hypothetical protein BV25DRAFT_1769928, partial [Artomyces pyxidatus]